MDALGCVRRRPPMVLAAALAVAIMPLHEVVGMVEGSVVAVGEVRFGDMQPATPSEGQSAAALGPAAGTGFGAVSMPLDGETARDCMANPVSCNCPLLSASCHYESYMCDLSISELRRFAVDAGRSNFMSSFSHPLLNTLQTGRTSSGGMPAVQSPTGGWRPGWHAGPSGRRSAALRGTRPASRGHNRGVQAGASLLASMSRGRQSVTASAASGDALCSDRQVEDLEGCMEYYASCNENRGSLWKFAKARHSEAMRMDFNPLVAA